MEFLHVAGQCAAQLVDPRDERFEVVSVLDSSVLGDLFETFTLHPDQVDPQDGVVIERRQLSRGVADQKVQQLLHVDPCIFYHLS